MDENKCLKCGEGEPSYCEKCHQDLIGENARLQRENSVLKEIEEPINVLINFAVCCTTYLNCDEHCTYFNNEEGICGVLHEDRFELAKSVKILRKYFKMKGENNNEKEN